MKQQNFSELTETETQQIYGGQNVVAPAYNPFNHRFKKNKFKLRIPIIVY
ncbi:bacteriocin [Lactobacillus sp. ESL0684]|nr:bacteriocin [Lactobacillus sp. ESL0684]WEV43231.1 bacteriocin [Lactobacillus sp. ESL0684]